MDETNEVKIGIIRQYQAAPKKIQETLVSDEYIKTIKLVATKHRLTEEEEENLETETSFVLLNLERVEDFEQNIIGKSGINSEKTVDVANDIKQLVFKPLETDIATMRQEQEKIQPQRDIKAISRDNVLRDTLNPQRINKIITTVQSVPVPPKPETGAEENSAVIRTLESDIKKDPAIQNTIIQQKMAQPFTLSKQEKTQEQLPPTPPAPPNPPKKTDPYREAI